MLSRRFSSEGVYSVVAGVGPITIDPGAQNGFARCTELAQAIQQQTALVVERGGRITGYATAAAFFGHATAETNFDMQALIASVDSFGGPGILLPT